MVRGCKVHAKKEYLCFAAVRHGATDVGCAVRPSGSSRRATDRCGRTSKRRTPPRRPGSAFRKRTAQAGLQCASGKEQRNEGAETEKDIFMTCERSHTAAFTGHRTYRGEAAEALASLLGDLHAEGYRRFLCGMALGFDMAAAEAVLALRAAHPEVRLVCVVPFAGQDRRFPAVEQERYRRILEAADETVVLRDDYRPDCYARRNDRLTDGASAVVAWYDGSSGGTHYTVRRARRLGLRVLNLWQNPQAEFPGF